jgi:transcriptional regulator of arginine metabolism
MDSDTIIQRLLQKQDFSDQADLLIALEKVGLALTQSSLSRRLKAMGYSKQGGVYRPQSARAGFVTSVQSVAPNLIVIRTAVGFANALAVQLDAVPLPGQAGTIAGDDTVFVAIMGNKLAQAVAAAKEFLST